MRSACADFVCFRRRNFRRQPTTVERKRKTWSNPCNLGINGACPAPKLQQQAQNKHPHKRQFRLRAQTPEQFRCGTPTACTHTVSGSISLPSPGFFSPFPHGTGSLSVGREYLALEDGPPMFRQGFTCLALLDFTRALVSCTRLSLSMANLSRLFHYKCSGLRANPRSLVATGGISVDFFSSGYLDVSVHRVRFRALYIQARMTTKGSRVSPFGHLRVIAYCQLTEAFRRLSRPSSPPAAKASTVCA